VRHVVWDWNGTLLDDLEVVVGSVNASLAMLRAAPIDAEGYRTHYTRPVDRFYARLLGRAVGADEWVAIDETFHRAYRAGLDRAHLAAGAVAAMDAVRAAGRSQSLLSMWWHEELVPHVTARGLAGYFVRVDGNRHAAGDTKEEHLRRHLAALGEADAAQVLVIGDALDDARAAAAVGTACVLYDGGSHHRGELDAAGVPVAESLLDAVRLGGIA
jgi:phosphoglycolate phosphatase-like HAD superfamily hydrolase